MENIFRKKFTARRLFHWFQDCFPYSFTISIHEDQNQPNASPDYSKEVFSHNLYFWKRKKDNRIYHLYDSMLFRVYSGCENTYVQFLIQDNDGKLFSVSWGYKRCDVEENYLSKFLNIYMDTIHNREICADIHFNFYNLPDGKQRVSSIPKDMFAQYQKEYEELINMHGTERVELTFNQGIVSYADSRFVGNYSFDSINSMFNGTK